MSVRHKNSSDVRTSARNGRFSATLYSGIYWLHPELGRWNKSYRKIPKVSPGTYIFQRPFLRGLSMEGNLRFKIDSGSPLVGTKCTIFALFYFVFEGNFQIQDHPPPLPGEGVYICRSERERRFPCVTSLGGLYTWGAYFRNFTICFCCPTGNTVSFGLCKSK